MHTIQNYIAGELHPPVADAWLDNYEPATGKVYGRIARSDAQDVALAVRAAQQALPAWSTLAPQDRCAWLEAIAQAIEERTEELIAAESKDNGKPEGLARKMDIPRAADNFRYYAQVTRAWASEAHAVPGKFLNYTLRQPVGVVGCISPWNLPLYLFTWKIAPALAAGCTVVAKPSELTPLTAFILSEICADVDLPPGVLNIVHGLGPEVGEAIVTHPSVKAISFTGGTTTGARIASQAAPHFKKLSLELGGKNPAIAFEDAGVDLVVKDILRSGFLNQGQICLCTPRVFLHKAIYQEVKQGLIEHLQHMQVGDPQDGHTHFGALVSQAHYEKVLGYIQLAQQEGATIAFGGQPVAVPGRCAGGWFIQPTILEGLGMDCRTNQEEIFGPVISLMAFEEEEQVIAQANAVRYGLAATVYTSNLARAHRVAEQLQAALVWVNCWLVRDLRTPFGGVKQSGMGREGGFEALRFFTEAKNVCVKY